MELSTSHILSACLACGLLAGCSEKKAEGPAPERPAHVVVVTPHKLAFVAQGAGRIQSRYVSQVGFEVGGRLTSRDVDIGSVVSKGQRLAQLNAVDFQNKVVAAQADLTAAKATLAQAAPQEQRYRILLEQQITTRPIYENALRALQSAQAQVQAAEANLRIAKDQLSYTELLAPDDGVVTATAADPGQVVSAGQRVVEISRSAEREAVFSVASEHVAHARLGMPVKVWVQGRPEIAVVGSIRQISPEADSTTGTYEVKVALPSPPPDMRLGAVVVGRAETEGPDVISVPTNALWQSGARPQLWTVANDGTVHRKSIEILEFSTESVVVRSGLSGGETVVVAGVNSLAEGQRVKPETEAN